MQENTNETHGLTARLNKDYALRVIAVTGLFFAGFLWLLYDGFIGYNRVNAAVAPVANELIESGMTAAELIEKDEATNETPFTQAFKNAGVSIPKSVYEKLKTLAKSAADSPTLQEDTAVLLAKPVYDADAIRGQFVTAGIALICILLLGGLLYVRSTVFFRLQGEVLSVVRKRLGSANETIYALSDLEKIDWEKWSDKQIAVFHFKDASQQKMDGWFYSGIVPLVEAVVTERPDLAPPATPPKPDMASCNASETN